MTKEEVINNLDWILLHKESDRFATATLSEAKFYAEGWQTLIDKLNADNKNGKYTELLNWIDTYLTWRR